MIGRHRTARGWIVFLVFATAGAVPRPVTAEGRFTAEFADDARVEADEIQSWHETKAQPSLAGRALFDPANPARWVIDTSLAPGTEPTAFVEYVGGDRLPGRVTSARSGAEDPYHRLPSHLVVAVQGAWSYPGQTQESVRVMTRWLRRVVWQKRSSSGYHPGTIFFVDGRRLSYRALRWNTSSVSVLLEQETTQVPFAEIAELHLPPLDAWEAFADQLAILSPEASARLIQVESLDGLRLTASTERFQARSHGNPGDPNHWHHMLQPAWALDALWLPHRAIRVRRFFAPSEMPLAWFDPVRSEQQPGLSGGLAWRRNLNVHGNPLESGGLAFSGGIGVHGEHLLEFRLPPGAREFRTRIGLDRAAGRGGCARARILADEGEQLLFESELLIGSAKLVDTGVLPLPANSDEPRRLLLATDMAHDERPAGADPFDIRDSLDWLEPTVVLDASWVQSAIRTRPNRLLPAWEGWTLENASAAPLLLSHRWERGDGGIERYVTESRSRIPFLTWSRKLRVRPEQNWLVLAVSRAPDKSEPSQIQVRIDGRAVAEFDVPVRPPLVDPAPLHVPLWPYQGREVTLAVTQLPGGPQATLEWRGIAVTGQSPNRLVLFQEGPEVPGLLREGEGTAHLEQQDVYAGRHALRVEAGDVGIAQHPRFFAAIRERPRVGEFRYISFAWKKRGGGRICLQFAQDGLWPPPEVRDDRQSLRYDAGPGEPSFGAARRVAAPSPEEWTVVTRDLFADFGSVDLTGIAFASLDGGEALFDHIILARTRDELDNTLHEQRTQPLALFEDQFSFPTLLHEGSGNAALDADDRYSGARSLKVKPARRGTRNNAFAALGAEICENPGPSQYRYVRFAWKKEGGKQILLQIEAAPAADAKPGAPGARFGYAGGEVEVPGAAIKTVAEELPGGWTVVTRDLFADFGEFTLGGLTFSPLDGEAAWFDHLYLARSLSDLPALEKPEEASANTESADSSP